MKFEYVYYMYIMYIDLVLFIIKYIIVSVTSQTKMAVGFSEGFHNKELQLEKIVWNEHESKPVIYHTASQLF